MTSRSARIEEALRWFIPFLEDELDEARATHGEYSTREFATWILKAKAALAVVEEPAPSHVVGHLDNGSEVRTGFGGDAPVENGCSHHGPGCSDPQPYPAPVEEERCPDCGGIGSMMGGNWWDVQKVCRLCGGTGRATNGKEIK